MLEVFTLCFNAGCSHTLTVICGNLFLAVKHIRYTYPTHHATHFSYPKLPSGIKILNLKAKGMCVKRVLQFVTSHIFYNCCTYLLTHSFHGEESFLRSYMVLGQSRNFPHFMEPKGSLPNLQMPANWPCPKLTTLNIDYGFFILYISFCFVTKIMSYYC